MADSSMDEVLNSLMEDFGKFSSDENGIFIMKKYESMINSIYQYLEGGKPEDIRKVSKIIRVLDEIRQTMNSLENCSEDELKSLLKEQEEV